VREAGPALAALTPQAVRGVADDARPESGAQRERRERLPEPQLAAGTGPAAEPRERAIAAAPVSPMGAEAAARAEAPAAGTGADVAGRVARVLELQQAQPAQPLRHVTLRVDAPDGTQDRIRLDLRGQTLQTTIEAGSTTAADRLQSQVAQLQRALERHGLDPEAVRVRHTAAARPEAAAELLRPAAPLAEPAPSARGGSDSNLPRERGQNSPDRDPDGSRHDSRREHQGGNARD
jgi:hypothetical protein